MVLVGTVLLTLGTFGEYYTPYLDFSFLALSVPGIISLMLGSTLFGISTLGAKVAPRLAAYARRLPWDNPETVLFGHLSGGLVAT